MSSNLINDDALGKGENSTKKKTLPIYALKLPIDFGDLAVYNVTI